MNVFREDYSRFKICFKSRCRRVNLMHDLMVIWGIDRSCWVNHWKIRSYKYPPPKKKCYLSSNLNIKYKLEKLVIFQSPRGQKLFFRILREILSGNQLWLFCSAMINERFKRKKPECIMGSFIIAVHKKLHMKCFLWQPSSQ